jgi:hypothetical protein
MGLGPMLQWLPIVILPNIDVHCCVEARYATVVGVDDDRVVALCEKHGRLRTFMSAFTDAFRRPTRPSLLLVREDAPETYRSGRAVCGFRDAVAMSAIPFNRALAILSKSPGNEPLFSNSFDFYPWMIDKHYRQVTLRTPAMRASDELESFAGQTSPEVDKSVVAQMDEIVVHGLLKRWESRFSSDDPTWQDRALFRSLNMATHAARTPHNTVGTFYDYGRLVALWVSAFEVLNYGGKRKTGKKDVLKVLIGHSGAAIRTSQNDKALSLRAWALDQVYRARNDYLHGNPVSDDRLMLPEAPVDIGFYASLLYRIMLAEFLGLGADLLGGSADASSGHETAGKAIDQWLDAQKFEKRIEEALSTMKG